MILCNVIFVLLLSLKVIFLILKYLMKYFIHFHCYLILYSVYHNLFIHYTFDGQLDYFQFGPTMNKAVKKLSVLVFSVHMSSFLSHLYVHRNNRLPRWLSLPMQDTWVWSLGREDPLEEEIASHSSILDWEIPWREKPGRLPSVGSEIVQHDVATETTKNRVAES